MPAFVAEESSTRDQPRTLVLGGSSPASVSYTLVRGSGARLGDAELAASGGGNSHLDKVVANLVAGSGADQGSQLSGFAIRYVLVRDGAPREMSRVLDATPGLSRLSQLDGSALWRVDRQIARIMIVPSGAGGEQLPVGSQPVEAHSKIPAGGSGRVLRIADAADPGWHATLNGRALTGRTVDGWAQGFELPAEGGRLDLTYETPLTHTAWIWAQAALGVVLLVLALPGRRREIDDDLPEESATVPAEPVAGEGRRARRLRAAAQAEAAAEDGDYDGDDYGDGGERPAEAAGEYIPAQQTTDPYAQQPEGIDAYGHGHQAQDPYDPQGDGQYVPQGEDGQYASVPQQHQYGEWDAQQYQGGEYAQYQGEQQQPDADPYQQGAAQAYDPYGYPQQQYDQGQYDQNQGGQYDQGQYSQYEQGPYDPQAPYSGQAPYDPQHPDENPAPAQNPWPTGNASRGESE